MGWSPAGHPWVTLHRESHRCMVLRDPREKFTLIAVGSLFLLMAGFGHWNPGVTFFGVSLSLAGSGRLHGAAMAWGHDWGVTPVPTAGCAMPTPR